MRINKIFIWDVVCTIMSIPGFACSVVFWESFNSILVLIGACIWLLAGFPLTWILKRILKQKSVMECQ